MKIEKTAEDYLEAMLMVRERYGFIRSIDVAAQLGVTKPSVTYTTKRLRENGLITMDTDNHILLTEDGLAIARHIYERHQILSDFFIRLGVNEDTARQDACRIEHDLSDETFDAICSYANIERKN